MVSASQKRKSLFDFPGSAGATGFGRMGTYTAASTCARTSAVTGGYNQELNSFLRDMRATQAADAARYGDKLFTPNSAARQRGVELAWRYEKKSILMGGKGSENWTAAERREIVDTGSLRGSQAIISGTLRSTRRTRQIPITSNSTALKGNICRMAIKGPGAMNPMPR